MKYFCIGWVLVALQVYLTFNGVQHFEKYWSPVILFIVSISTAWVYLRVLLREKSMLPTTVIALAPRWQKALGALVGMVSVGLCYEELRKAFVRYVPHDYSDVLPQIEMLYARFSTGVFPYSPVPMGNYSPYPVYMPLHWLPVGLPAAFGVDVRWVGFGLLVLAAGLYGWLSVWGDQPLWRQLAALVLPSLSLWGYILWGEMDLPVSLESVIAAYYLVLAVGLVSRRIGWVTAGIILCLLSRYTLVFWLPLFALLLWQNLPRRQNLVLWATVAASVFLVYVLPFYAQDPSILTKGVAYHNLAAVDEWRGYGDPPVSWTMERGVHFAAHLKEVLPGDARQQVLGARVVQALAMLSLLLMGWLGYRRWRNRINFNDFSLLMLYLFILFFYFFGPLTYRYYLIVLHTLAAVLCGQIIVRSGRLPRIES